MRVAWLGVIAALAAASVPVVAWACYSGPMPESLALELESVAVAGQPSTDLASYDGYRVSLWAEPNGSMTWTAEKGTDYYHASYDR